MKTIKSIQKIVNPCKGVFCKIKYEDKRLSISGAINPKRDGDADSCGQIYDSILEYPLIWSKDKVTAFIDVWKKHHLNDMNPGCVHSDSWDKDFDCVFYHYKLNMAIWQLQEKINEKILKDAKENKFVELPKTELFLLNLPYEIITIHKAFINGNKKEVINGIVFEKSDFETWYKLDKTETKKSNWTYPKEHPQGILTKKCEICGLEYGGAWYFRDVPQDVLEFLNNFPETKIIPAWC